MWMPNRTFGLADNTVPNVNTSSPTKRKRAHHSLLVYPKNDSPQCCQIDERQSRRAFSRKRANRSCSSRFSLAASSRCNRLMLRLKASDLPLTAPSCLVCAGSGCVHGSVSVFGDDVAIPVAAEFMFLTLSIESINHGEGRPLTLCIRKAVEPVDVGEMSTNAVANLALQHCSLNPHPASFQHIRANCSGENDRSSVVHVRNCSGHIVRCKQSEFSAFPVFYMVSVF